MPRTASPSRSTSRGKCSQCLSKDTAYLLCNLLVSAVLLATGIIALLQGLGSFRNVIMAIYAMYVTGEGEGPGGGSSGVLSPVRVSVCPCVCLTDCLTVRSDCLPPPPSPSIAHSRTLSLDHSALLLPPPPPPLTAYSARHSCSRRLA